MDRTQIMDILPHRDSMLLLDGAERDGDTARGTYNVRGGEWFLDGHFPGDPVVPGVVLCEIMAQSVCVLLEGRMSGKTPYLTGIDGARFKSAARPGDVIRTRCVITKQRPPFYFAKGEAYIGEKLCAKADFSFYVL
ncbi:MAG: beta-hydroxyacyl-ACP dehydratase [Oscillospiraceae bacterium]|jgi:3-hydroxyacyl-[acyl-carrier-protein] dehydratase|nr:beta-hydroxyacyl-ACP dehydratase [Oscillospiraceae bacterium]